MAKKAKKAAPKVRKKIVRRVRHDGIPRTLAAAERHGLKKLTVNFSARNEAEKANWVPISTANAKRGELALVRPATGEPPPFNVAPTDNGDSYIVCYFNSVTRNYDLNCHEVPASEVMAMRARRR